VVIKPFGEIVRLVKQKKKTHTKNTKNKQKQTKTQKTNKNNKNNKTTFAFHICCSHLLPLLPLVPPLCLLGLWPSCEVPLAFNLISDEIAKGLLILTCAFAK
jgi:hypothetical protein